MTAALIFVGVLVIVAVLGLIGARQAIPTFGEHPGSHARARRDPFGTWRPARLRPRRLARKAARAIRRRFQHAPRSKPGPLQIARVNALVAATAAKAAAWSVPDPADLPHLQRAWTEDTDQWSASEIFKGE